MAITLTATYPSPPAASVQVAELFANKRLAFGFQKDDGYADDYRVVFKVTNGGTVGGVTYPGVTHSDGAGRLLHAGYTFALIGAAVAAGGNSTLTAGPQYMEMVAAGNIAVANHGNDHNLDNGAAYQISQGQANILAATGFLTRTFVDPNNLPELIPEALNRGYLLATSEGFGQNEINAGIYANIVSYGDRVIVGGDRFSPTRNISSRTSFDGQWVAGIPGIKQWINERFAYSASSGKRVLYTAFSHGVNDSMAAHIAAMFDYIKTHPSNIGGDEAWLCTSQDFAEYQEARALSVLSTPTVTGNTLALSIDQSAIPAVSRNRSMSLLLPTGMTGVSVTGVDSFTYNPTTGLVNLYISAASATPVQRWRPGRNFGAPSGFNRITLAAPNTTVALALRHRESRRIVRTWLPATYAAAGPVDLLVPRTDRRGNTLPGAHTDYDVVTTSFRQASDTPAAWAGAIGNSATTQIGARALGGGNLYEKQVFVQLPANVSVQVQAPNWLSTAPVYEQVNLLAGEIIFFGVTGYAERSPNIYWGRKATPNVVYRLHELSELSATFVVVTPDNERLLIGGEMLFGADTALGRYAGPGLFEVNLRTFQDVNTPGSRTMETDNHRGANAYHIFGDKQYTAGAGFLSGLTATATHYIACYENEGRITAYLRSDVTQQQHTYVDRPREIAATGSMAWLAYQGSRTAEKFTISNGLLTATGTTLPGTTCIGSLAIYESEVVATDVAEFGRALEQVFDADTRQPLNQFTQPIVRPREIVWFGYNTYQYVGAVNVSLTPNAFAALGAGNATYVKLAGPLAMGTSHHAVRAFNVNTGVATWKRGQGDYAADPAVAHLKWFFADTRIFNTFGQAGCFAVPMFGGDWAVGDKGNCQVVHMDAAGTRINLCTFTGITYNIASNPANPARHWHYLMPYRVDYAKRDMREPGAYYLEANYSCSMRPGLSSTFERIVTVAGQEFAHRADLPAYRYRIVRIEANGLVDTGQLSTDLSAALLEDGAFLEPSHYSNIDGRAMQVDYRPCTGVVNGVLQHGPLQEAKWAPSAWRKTDPIIAKAPSVLGPNGELIIYNIGVPGTNDGPGGVGCYHTGVLYPGEGTFRSLGGESTRKSYHGRVPYGDYFEIGNDTGNGGSFYSVFNTSKGMLSFTGAKDEFGYQGGQNNKYKLRDRNHTFLLEIGETRYGVYAKEPSQPGQGGNGDTGYVHVTDGGTVIRFYQGSEGAGVVGICQWVLADLIPTLTYHPEEQLKGWYTPPTKQGHSLFEGMPYDTQLTGNNSFGRWSFVTAPGTELVVQTDRNTMPWTGRSIDIGLNGTTPNADEPGATQVLAACTLGPLPSDQHWKLEMGFAFEGLEGAERPYLYYPLVINDNAGKRLFQLDIVKGESGRTDIQANGVTVQNVIANLAVKWLYFAYPIRISSTADNRIRFSHPLIGTYTVDKVDAGANVLRAGSLAIPYKNFKGGGCRFSLEDTEQVPAWFTPLAQPA